MHKTLFIALLAATPLTAAPLTLPEGAIQIGTRTDAPSQYALAIAAFDGTKVPTQIITGTLTQNAYRLDAITGNTLSLLQPLSDQLTAQGYKVTFTCDTTACGGFDFRFAIDVLPEPQMHVDLGDFRYLAATKAGDAVSLLVSRSADQGFVQITTVTANTTPTAPIAASQAKADDPAKTFTPMQQFEIVSTPPASDFDTQLTATGSVPLDDLIFASGKASLLDQDYASLAALADWLKTHPDLKVTLVGHTDATGTLAGNVALSKQRAASVRDWLIQHYQASAKQIDAQGAGYLSPRASNQTPEGRTKNRRVEVMLTSTPVK